MKFRKVIGEGYLTRYYLIPGNRFLNIYLHIYYGSDDDRALHDHPWYSLSIRLWGKMADLRGYRISYDDVTNCVCDPFSPILFERRLGRVVFRRPLTAHRIVLRSKTAATIFITGPRLRVWGFYCGKKWLPWWKMTTPDGRPIGGRCD